MSTLAPKSNALIEDLDRLVVELNVMDVIQFHDYALLECLRRRFLGSFEQARSTHNKKFIIWHKQRLYYTRQFQLRRNVVNAFENLHNRRVAFQGSRVQLQRMDDRVIAAYLAQKHPFLPPAEERERNQMQRETLLGNFLARRSAISAAKDTIDLREQLACRLLNDNRVFYQNDRCDVPSHFLLFLRFHDKLIALFDRLFQAADAELEPFDDALPNSAPPQSIYKPDACFFFFG